MLDLTRLSSPLQSPEAAVRTGPAAARAVLRERPFLGRIMLHLDPRDDLRPAEVALGTPLPARGSAAAVDELSVLSLARDAYLLITPPNGQYALMPRLRAALSGRQAAITDVSSGYATFRLSGPAATELLYRGCSVPLDAPDFKRGSCMTTKVGKVTAIIHQTDDAPDFDIHVPRSLALFFWAWLAEAGRDCALLIEAGGADGSTRISPNPDHQ